VFDFLGIALAGGDEGGECGTLFWGQSNFVNLSHGIAGVGVTMRKDTKSAKDKQEQYRQIEERKGTRESDFPI